MARRRSPAKAFVAFLLVIPAICAAACGPARTSEQEEAARQDVQIIVDAFREKKSDVVVEATGTVERILADDTHFPRHQRFILRIAHNHTLLIAHNIDLAPRAPIEEGDRIRFRGEYEWNEQGGVVHWTHHDPEGHRPGGWIEVDGRRYR